MQFANYYNDRKETLKVDIGWKMIKRNEYFHLMQRNRTQASKYEKKTLWGQTYAFFLILKTLADMQTILFYGWCEN